MTTRRGRRSSCGGGTRRRPVCGVFAFALLIGLAESWQHNIPARNSVRYGKRRNRGCYYRDCTPLSRRVDRGIFRFRRDRVTVDVVFRRLLFIRRTPVTTVTVFFFDTARSWFSHARVDGRESFTTFKRSTRQLSRRRIGIFTIRGRKDRIARCTIYTRP